MTGSPVDEGKTGKNLLSKQELLALMEYGLEPYLSEK
jgi:hypothetical protein